MKFLICLFALVAAALAAPPEYTGNTKDGHARTVSYQSEQAPDGSSWGYSIETENGISQAEHGVIKPTTNGEAGSSVEGGFQYPNPQGGVIAVRFTAGEEGFVAQGDHLPLPPPIPEAILRGLEWNAAHPEEEKQWDPENYKPVQPTYNGR